MNLWKDIDVIVPGEPEPARLHALLAMVQRLGLRNGEPAYVFERADGSFILSRHPPKVQAEIEMGLAIMARYDEVFAALAKS